MAIAFDQIPGTWRLPGAKTEFNNELANRGATLKAFRGLIVGQMLAGGKAEAGKLVRISRAEQAAELFGAGSQIGVGAAAWFKNNGDYIETWALPLADAGEGVAATAKITFTGTAQESGAIYLYIGGVRVPVAVLVNDTAAVQATKTAAAINAATGLTVSAVAAAEVVTLTAKNKGAVGNDVDLRINYYPLDEKTPAGIKVAFTPFAGGTGNPDLTAAVAAMGDLQFDAIVLPYTDAAALKAMEDEMQSRWGAMRAIDGMFFAASAKGFSALTTLGNSRNSPFACIGGLPKTPSQPFALAAAMAAQAAFAAQNDPARPFQTLELVGILPPAENDRLTEQERNILLFNGISTYRINAGGSVLIEMLISTYKTGKYGQTDDSYLMINTVWTLSYLRYDWNAYIVSKYPRHKLADDGNKFGAGQPIMTPKQHKAEMVSRAKLWMELGLVENIDQFTADSFSERNLANPNRLDSLFVPDLVNQMIVFANKVQFISS